VSSVVEPPPPVELVSEPPPPSPPPAKSSRRRRTLLRDILEVLALAFALYIVIAFALQTVRVDGESMEPTLQNSDLLFADKLSYHLHAPERGDIIVLRPPDQPNTDFIKRIVAVPDDFVEIDGKHLNADGSTSAAVLVKTCLSCAPQVLKEPYLPDQKKEPWTEMVFCCDSTGHATGEPTWLHVPQDMYFVLGDNRNHSRDSRSIGLIPRNNILGRAWVRIWPLSHFGFLCQGPTLATAAALIPVPFWWRRRVAMSRRSRPGSPAPS
jgi:signal peptidase I